MKEKYQQIKNRYAELEQAMQSPDILADQKKYGNLAKEFAELKK